VTLESQLSPAVSTQPVVVLVPSQASASTNSICRIATTAFRGRSAHCAGNVSSGAPAPHARVARLRLATVAWLRSRGPTCCGWPSSPGGSGLRVRWPRAFAHHPRSARSRARCDAPIADSPRNERIAEHLRKQVRLTARDRECYLRSSRKIRLGDERNARVRAAASLRGDSIASDRDWFDSLRAQRVIERALMLPSQESPRDEPGIPPHG
jgi:hypothetical protein